MKKNKIFKASAAVIAAAAVIFTGYKLLFEHDERSVASVDILSAKQELADHKFGKYENITFDCRVRNTEFEKVYEKIETKSLNSGKGSVISKEQLLENARGLLKTLRGDDADVSSLIYSNEEDYQGVINTSDDMIFSYGGGGSFLWVDFNETGRDDKVYEDDYSRVEKCIFADKIGDESYNIGGESWALKEAAEYAEKLLDTKLSRYLDIDEPMIAKAIVAYIPSTDEYFYLFRFYQMIEGIPRDDSGTISPDEEYLLGGYIDIEFRRKEKISYMESFASRAVADKTEAERIIPLSEAEKIASEHLAPVSRYTITECELKYVIVKKDIADNEIFRPMWVMTLSEKKEKSYSFRNNNFEADKIYIDAATGEYFLYQYIPDIIIRDGDSRYGRFFA